MVIDPATLERREVYKLLIGSVVPRPIAWVSSMNAEGQPNLAPFSYFNVACSNPPTRLICRKRQEDVSNKATLLNLDAPREFVIHIAGERTAEAMNAT